MTAYNVVRNRVRPGREKDFERAIRNIERDMPGWRKLAVIKTGERTYCIIGEWDNMESIVAARPKMIKSLDAVFVAKYKSSRIRRRTRRALR